MLRIESASLPPRLPKTDALASFLWEGGTVLPDDHLSLEPSQKKVLEKWIRQEAFQGREGEQIILYPSPVRCVPKWVITGLGPRKKLTLEVLRRNAGRVLKTCQKKVKNLWILPPDCPEMQDVKIGRALAEGLQLASYQYHPYRRLPREEIPLLNKVILIPGSPGQMKRFRTALAGTQWVTEAVLRVRDWVNRPPSDKRPKTWMEEAKKLSGSSIRVKIFNPSQIRKLGMNALLGVARGSSQNPVFIHLIYRPRYGKPEKKIALVGKGIVFDSGGLSLKGAEHMQDMKMDMAGAAVVMEIFRVLPRTSCRSEVHGFLPVTYNMPGSDAVKPGDVLKALNGKTIEVLNTDAEGRLILADALSYACRQKPDQIIDLATLTGAAVVALGSAVTAAMTNHPPLLKQIFSAAEKTGEKIWELPLVPEYKENIKSAVADIQNISSVRGEAGAIIGGLFLQEFVGKTPWVHLDIAGPAWSSKESPYCSKGGTGAMTRTLLEYLCPTV